MTKIQSDLDNSERLLKEAEAHIHCLNMSNRVWLKVQLAEQWTKLAKARIDQKDQR